MFKYVINTNEFNTKPIFNVLLFYTFICLNRITKTIKERKPVLKKNYK